MKQKDAKKRVSARGDLSPAGERANKAKSEKKPKATKQITLRIGENLQTLEAAGEGPIENGEEMVFRFEFDPSSHLDSYFKAREDYLSAMVKHIITMPLSVASDSGSRLLSALAKRVILGTLRCFDLKEQQKGNSLDVIRVDGSDHFPVTVTDDTLAEVLKVVGGADPKILIIRRPLVSQLPESFAVDYFYPGLFSRRFVVDQSVDWFLKDAQALVLSSWEIGLG